MGNERAGFFMHGASFILKTVNWERNFCFCTLQVRKIGCSLLLLEH